MKLGAIFDMDGLLFDTERVYNEALYFIANQYGLHVEQEMLNKLRGTSGETMYNIVNTYWDSVDSKQLCDELFAHAKKILQHHVPVKEGVYEILSFFKEHHVKMAIASSAPRKLILHNIKEANIQDYFDVIVSGDQVQHSKPSPDIFLLAADKLKLSPRDCYVFEDGIHGVKAAVLAGCATIMIPDLLPPTPQEYASCIGIYKSLDSFLNELKSQIEHF